MRLEVTLHLYVSTIYMLHLMKSELETVLNESTETNLSPASVAGPGQGGYSRIQDT